MNETRTGGLLMLSGAILILITIFFEYNIGWIGVERAQAEIPRFLFDNWEKIKLIWGFQGVGHVLFTMSYILLLKKSSGIFSLFWAFMVLCGVVLVISMGLTLGGYFPALKYLSDQPGIFDSLRGAIRILYSSGLFGFLMITIIYCLEVFGKDGVIIKRTGFLVLAIVVTSILIGAFTIIPLKVIGALCFLIPLSLGYGYFRNT